MDTLDSSYRLLKLHGVLKAYNLNQEYPFLNPVIVDSREGNIGGDPEGVAIYKTSDTEGYVILSSQGDNKYNVYNRQKLLPVIDIIFVIALWR